MHWRCDILSLVIKVKDDVSNLHEYWIFAEKLYYLSVYSNHKNNKEWIKKGIEMHLMVFFYSENWEILRDNLQYGALR